MYLLVLFLVDYFIITDLRDYASLISTNFTKKKKSPCSHTDFFDQFNGLETTVSPQTADKSRLQSLSALPSCALNISRLLPLMA